MHQSLNKEAMGNPWSKGNKNQIRVDKFGELKIEGGYTDILSTQFTIDTSTGQNKTESISTMHNKIKEEYKRDRKEKELAGQKGDVEKT